MEEVDLLGRPLHAQPSLASLLAWETSMSAYTFGEMLSDGASHAAAADAAAEERSTAETEDIMSAEEGDPNAESRPGAAEEGGPTAATRPAADEEGDTTTATRAAAAAAQETDVCSVCQYRGRKLKHT